MTEDVLDDISEEKEKKLRYEIIRRRDWLWFIAVRKNVNRETSAHIFMDHAKLILQNSLGFLDKEYKKHCKESDKYYKEHTKTTAVRKV